MCFCGPEEYPYEERSVPRVVSMSEKSSSSYGRYAQPSSHYTLSSGRPSKRQSVRIAEHDPHPYDSGYESVGASLRRESFTPPPVLIQTRPMGCIDTPNRPSSVAPGGGRRPFGARSGEMGYNQPRILFDGGLGPIVHQGHSAAGFQIPHHTGHPAHMHSSGPRASIPRQFSISANPQRGRSGRYVGYRDERNGWREERGYSRDDYRDDRGSSSSEDSWASDRRLFPGSPDKRSSYAAPSSTESFYTSPSLRRFS
ncbi:unnamed protein product [Tuber melanosporum]|uniref:(Perigord truffle) hypothetical protein n=1 Tax=Tuber melanosporum (strain Mel28) TaxID=656061 RepID=D5GLS6_TUBMM|nr:uncharacterized protein GSTUM_00010395001 [Tuber melanosporum]CAZ85493.1 unnamed protein product [Tuber melanosporum]